MYPLVLITGAARRVGAQLARTLHEAGADILLHYRDAAAEAQRLADQLNARRADSAATLQADLRDIAALPELVEVALARFGRLDALINNASSFYPTPLGQITEADWDNLIGSNFKGPLFLAQAAAFALSASAWPGGGVIINITDIHAERPLKNYPLYCAAKAGLLGLTRALAVDLAPQVRVNAVAPGAILWPEQGDDFPQPAREQIIAHALLRRSGTPQDIARAVRFLVFDAPYVTGQVINVDGGRSAHL